MVNLRERAAVLYEGINYPGSEIYVRSPPYVEYETSFKTLMDAPCARHWRPSHAVRLDPPNHRARFSNRLRHRTSHCPDGNVQSTHLHSYTSNITCIKFDFIS